MDEPASLADRLLEALNASGVSDTTVVRLCETLEAGVKALYQVDANKLLAAHRTVDWREVFGVTKQGTIKSMQERRITTYGVLQMLNELDLCRIHLIGITKTDQIRLHLKDKGLRLREPNEPFTERANQIYGSVERVPIAVLLLWLIRYYSEQEYKLVDRFDLATIGEVRMAATEDELTGRGQNSNDRFLLAGLYRAAQPERLAKY